LSFDLHPDLDLDLDLDPNEASIELRPAYADAHFNLASTLAEASDLEG